MTFGHRRRSRRAAHVAVVAMAGLAFNVVLCFMLVTSFGRGPQLEVELATVAEPPGAVAAAVVVVAVDAHGQYRVDGRPAAPDELPVLLRARLGALRDGAVVIAADRAAAWSQIVKVIDLARQLRVGRIEMSLQEARR